MSEKRKKDLHNDSGVVIESLTPKATRAEDAAALDRLIAQKDQFLPQHQWQAFHENAPRHCPRCGQFENIKPLRPCKRTAQNVTNQA